MIQKSTLLGVSLRTRRNRRLLVVAYYLFVLALTLVPLTFGVAPVAILSYLPQAIVLGGLLGGLMYGGVVKPFSPLMLNRNPDSFNPIALGLEPATRPDSTSLDERETTERDRAHFYAYRILLGLMVLLLLVVWLLAASSAAAAQRSVPILVWLLVVTAFSLPQTVILWTEPDPHPEGSLALV